MTDETKGDVMTLEQALACVDSHLSRMNRYYHEKVAWQVIKDHLAGTLCARCKGAGEIDQTSYHGEDVAFDGMIDCPSCAGTGAAQSAMRVDARSVARKALHDALVSRFGMNPNADKPSAVELYPDGDRELEALTAALQAAIGGKE